MTGPEDSHTGTRPISVAELLAKNGTIGAPPVGGRRRRRRGNSDSVTVAELTGEIPVVTDDPEPEARDEPDPGLVDTAVVAAVDAGPSPRNGRNGIASRRDSKPDVERDPAQADYARNDAPANLTRDPAQSDYARNDAPANLARNDAPANLARNDAPANLARNDAEADYDAHLKARDADPEPIEFRPTPRRPQYSSPVREYKPSGTGAERMSPDPLEDLDGDETPQSKGSAKLVESAEDTNDTDEDRSSYLGSSLGPLFGGQSVADDLARRRRPSPEDIDLEDDADATERVDEREDLDEIDELDESESSPLVRGLWIVGQCIIAVAFGAGLFIAFDQLWKWNTIVALVLGVLVILGLAGGVRVVRKTEDIGSTLTAVAVGALVTFGPLALLQAS